MRVAFVVTRDLSESVGRANTVRAHLKSLNDIADVEVFRLPTATENAPVLGLLRVCWAMLRGLCAGRPLPLQVLLYGAGPEPGRLLERLRAAGPDAVVFDMVRCHRLIALCAQALPQVALITDMDDLLSRRISLAAQSAQPIALGMVASQLPETVARILALRAIAKRVAQYESRTLLATEQEIVGMSACTILVSPLEGAALAQACGAALAPRIRTIFPTAPIRRRAPSPAPGITHCVFVGGDHQQQNYLALKFLTGLWKKHCPSLELHVFGRKTRLWPEIEGLRWRGYAPSVAEAYPPGALALAPTFRVGGIKTKVLEAWSYGAAVALNEESLQGIDVDDYPLLFGAGDWARFCTDPQSFQEAAQTAVRLGQSWLELNCSQDSSRSAWRQVLGGGAG